MRESIRRAKATRLVAGVGIAIVAVGWLVLRGSTTSNASEGAPAIAVVRSEPPAKSPPDARLSLSSRLGVRVPETSSPEVEPEADSGEEDPSVYVEPVDSPTVRVLLVGDVIGPNGERVGGPHTRIDLEGALDTRTVPVVVGSYRIEDLEPGNYDLRCSAPGLRDERRRIVVSENEVVHREDFVLTPVWTVAIRLVTTDGRNFLDLDEKKEIPEGARLDVVATENAPPARWAMRSFEGRTHARGSRYVPRVREDEVIPGDPDGSCSGRLEIYRDPPVHLSAEIRGIVLATTRLDAPAEIVTLEIPLEALHGIACSLRGRVVDAESGAPIAGAMVMLAGGTAGIRCETDEHGLIVRDGLQPGSYTLWIMAEGRGFELRPLELAPGIENDIGKITVATELHLSGRLEGPAGQTVQVEAVIDPYLEDRPLETLDWQMHGGVGDGEDGVFIIGGLAPRKYLLVASANVKANESWWYEPVVVDLTHGSVEGLVVRAQAATKVRLHPESSAARDRMYWILAPNGLLCARGAFRSEGDTQLSLGAGSFRLLVGTDAASVREIPFTVGSEPVTISIGM